LSGAIFDRGLYAKSKNYVIFSFYLIFFAKNGYVVIGVYAKGMTAMTIVKTKYTLETHKEFLRFLFYRGKYYRYKRTAFTLLGLSLIFLWFMFYLVIPCGFPAILLLALGIIVLLWAQLVPTTLSKQNAKEASRLTQCEMNIVFIDNSVTILSEEGDGYSANVLLYENLYRIYETRKDFYVFITVEHAFIVSKNELSDDTQKELEILFQTKMDKDFVICK